MQKVLRFWEYGLRWKGLGDTDLLVSQTPILSLGIILWQNVYGIYKGFALP
jgi:hypothetical protein